MLLIRSFCGNGGFGMLLAVDVGNSNISVGVFCFTDARMPEIVCHFKFGTRTIIHRMSCARRSMVFCAALTPCRSMQPLYHPLYRR